ncbi:hypothetical protein F2Q69_00023747 [Brassica cretica]|uniref:Uncharacterized protein n=1 Tax=Brassica cretica TaxID=69181 RepID=A0A8S9QFF9_BRACR|nr:hypothetical protein F2Q69_00023747 [Brassica cretica]
MLGDEDQSSHRREKRYEPSNSIASIQLGFTLYWPFRLHSLNETRSIEAQDTWRRERSRLIHVEAYVGE